MSGSIRRGAATLSQSPSMLPDVESATRVVNTQILNGFWQFLPSRSTTFLDRVYFANYPRPLFVGNLPPYPVPVPLVNLEVPNNMAFVLKSFEFEAYEASGIGVDDMTLVPQARVATYVGFQISIGNRSPLDYNTNVSMRGQVIQYDPTKGSRGTSIAPLPMQGTIFPFAGPLEPLGEAFATYAVSGQQVNATAWILRPPQFEIRMFSVRISGYHMGQGDLKEILDKIVSRPQR